MERLGVQAIKQWKPVLRDKVQSTVLAPEHARLWHTFRVKFNSGHPHAAVTTRALCFFGHTQDPSCAA
jgi:hypothetical protein